MLKTAMDYYEDLLENQSDPRVSNLYLMKTLTQTVTLCTLYIFTVFFIGPKFMENRKPFELKKTLTTYNIMQVFTSGFLFYECLAAGWLTKYGIFKCHSVDFTDNSNSQRELRIMYFYFLSKFTEFFDTIFFVLRKKSSQVTFLHVYHHVSMPLYTWAATKFNPGGSLTVAVFLNSFIHVVMYSYYLLAGLGPHMQKYLWWKKYLTVMQLIQFALGVLHFTVVLFSGSDCNISKILILVYIAIGIFFYVLFSSFYKESYKKPTMNNRLKIVEDDNKNECVKNGFSIKSCINNNEKIKCP